MRTNSYESISAFTHMQAQLMTHSLYTDAALSLGELAAELSRSLLMMPAFKITLLTRGSLELQSQAQTKLEQCSTIFKQ